jgi:hypothetical protein
MSARLTSGELTMIIWSGWGFMVALIVFGASLLAEVSIESSVNDMNYYQSHSWPLAVALLGSAVVTWFLGSFLNRQPGPTAIDHPTGREEVLRDANRHRFFFIPMQYWGPILAALAIVSFALR